MSYVNTDEDCRLIRRINRRLVFVNGCFDVLHPGHMMTLQHARFIADRGVHGIPTGSVVVGINSDESAKRLKGPGRPVFDENFRREMLLSTRYVDHVLIFDEDTPLNMILALSPDVVVKGGDYEPSSVVGYGMVEISISQYRKKYSTTKIIERIKKL